jgi:hypothetical protein
VKRPPVFSHGRKPPVPLAAPRALNCVEGYSRSLVNPYCKVWLGVGGRALPHADPAQV